ncbi:MAG: DUF4864 domain-containing protein [Gemmobacter sp.]|jgi:hypothetical protein
MTRLFQLAAALWLALVPMAQAQDAAIQGVIARQIEAFKADDFATAFTFASPAIKGIFGTPERFGQMVRQGYPMVHRPAEVRFLELREVQGRLWQRVMMTDAAGQVHLLEYQMIEAPEGWQINGVQILKGVGVGA